MIARPIRDQRGMSLVELAIILVILGLMLILAVAVVPRLTERIRLDTTSVSMTEISESIVGFAATHGRLPCPDDDGDGLENCTAVSGEVPYRNIGFPDPNLDRAHIGIRYAVYRNGAADADLTSVGNVFVPVLPGDPPTHNTDLPPPDPVPTPPVTSPPTDIGPLISEGVTHFLLDHHAPNQAAAPKAPTTINDLDFCRALRNARAASPSASFVHTLDGAAPVNVAFVLASGGVEDADGGGTDIAFDAANTGLAISFESPTRRRGVGYDDLVLAMPFDQIESRMSCGAITIGVNAQANLALAAAHMVAQAEDLLWQAERAIVMDDIAVAQAGFALALAILQTITAAADTAIAATSCPCPALPDNCAATAATAAAIALGVGSSIAAGVALDQAIRQQSINDEIYVRAIEDFHTFVTFAEEVCQDALDVETRGGQGNSP